jgi:hypothetical protein
MKVLPPSRLCPSRLANQDLILAILQGIFLGICSNLRRLRCRGDLHSLVIPFLRLLRLPKGFGVWPALHRDEVHVQFGHLEHPQRVCGCALAPVDGWLVGEVITAVGLAHDGIVAAPARPDLGHLVLFGANEVRAAEAEIHGAQLRLVFLKTHPAVRLDERVALDVVLPYRLRAH